MTTAEERVAIEDVIYRYASHIDSGRVGDLEQVLHTDLWAQYGNAEPIAGRDRVISWIREATSTCIWQHHFLRTYHVDVRDDRATALVYHTSYQAFAGDKDVCQLVGRYHQELTRVDGRWVISRLVFEIVWGERRTDSLGYLASVGGRGPEVPGWP
ncbi:nuclear transport factor 2 family protein [Nocardia sp. NPDC019395]|uniref:nuclear transport factor 2 family protein n=1 Tax=Nocardia sp. NPDC019395 TaxID=3154686 RepID=UPI0034046C45